jgi:hypothetical protein
MKKVLLILLFSILFVSSFSQKVYYKLKVGCNSSNVVINRDKPFDMELGPNGGMTIDIPFKKSFFCQTGLVYFHKGYDYKRVYYSGSGTPLRNNKASNNLHYLALPVMADYALKDRWHFFLGPQLSYLLAGRNKLDGTSTSPDYYHKFDFGAVVGTEYKLFKTWGIYAGYDYGVSKFMKGALFDTNGNLTGYKNVGSNRTIFLGIFYEGEVLVK